MIKGKVWLVGAGPSDAELLTLKGKKVIEHAQVVVYDRLVGQGILMMIPENIETIDVGKRAGNHTMPQEEINRLLLEKALEGKRVVRLKGGDPFLFGRGGEELELLQEHQIPYEIVPGITSALSVPAYHGIPVTHRDYCSSVHIITGHKKKGETYDMDFEALVRTKGTLVFLMGLSALGDICKGLLDAGMDKEIPAALLEKGTTSKQRRIIATLETLEQKVKEEKTGTPAIIVVGKVCTLAEEFSWYENLPLAGCKILVTRPKELQSVLSDKLKSQGAEVLEFPVIKTVARQENTKLQKALHQLETYQWLVFTSPSGVGIFFDAMREERIDIRKLGNIKIAAVGRGTGKRIEEKGLFVDLIPKVFDGESLGKELFNHCKDGERILIPRAGSGNEELVKELGKNESLLIEDIATYDVQYRKQEIIDVKSEFETGTIDLAIFTSAGTVKGFAESVKDLDYSLVQAVCIGKQTEAEAKKHGMKTICAKEATLDSLIEAAKEWKHRKEGS